MNPKLKLKIKLSMYFKIYFKYFEIDLFQYTFTNLFNSHLVNKLLSTNHFNLFFLNIHISVDIYFNYNYVYLTTNFFYKISQIKVNI